MNQKSGARFLIVNADDFGLTSGVTRGVIEAHERGIVTSASLMVRGSAAEEAAEYARAHLELSVGLHFDAEEWRFSHGEWERAYRVIDTANEGALRLEFERQCSVFERLVARAPTHLDSHQHVHLSEPARTILLEFAEQLQIPLRLCTPSIRYCGSFYGQTDEGESYPAGISVEAFIRMVQAQRPGWMEMGCHPGYPEGLKSAYSGEREDELRVLTGADLREALKANEVELRSFRDFPHRRP